jgi:hypothetical protein
MWKGRRFVLIGTMTVAVAAVGLGVAVGAEGRGGDRVDDVVQLKVRAISDILEKIREIRTEARSNRRMAFLGCVNERFNMVQGLKRIAMSSQRSLEKAIERKDHILMQQETKTIVEAANKADDTWSQVKACEKEEEDDVKGLHTDELEVHADDEVASLKDPLGDGTTGTAGGVGGGVSSGSRIPNVFDGGITTITGGGEPGGGMGGTPGEYVPPQVSPFQ